MRQIFNYLNFRVSSLDISTKMIHEAANIISNENTIEILYQLRNCKSITTIFKGICINKAAQIAEFLSESTNFKQLISDCNVSVNKSENIRQKYHSIHSFNKVGFNDNFIYAAANNVRPSVHKKQQQQQREAIRKKRKHEHIEEKSNKNLEPALKRRKKNKWKKIFTIDPTDPDINAVLHCSCDFQHIKDHFEYIRTGTTWYGYCDSSQMIQNASRLTMHSIRSSRQLILAGMAKARGCQLR